MRETPPYIQPGRSPDSFELRAKSTLPIHEAAGVLPHELAHAAAARLCLREVGSIVLVGAAAAAPSRQSAASPRRSLVVVALAGPLATRVLAGMWGFLARAPGPIGRDPTPAHAVLLCLYLAALLQGVLGLVAVGPLEGAVALRSLHDGQRTGGRRRAPVAARRPPSHRAATRPVVVVGAIAATRTVSHGSAPPRVRNRRAGAGRRPRSPGRPAPDRRPRPGPGRPAGGAR